MDTQRALKEAGWRLNDGNDLYEAFVDRRAFSLQNDVLIEVPEVAIGLDFSNVPTSGDRDVEQSLRACLVSHFSRELPDSLCFAIDVNHSEYRCALGDLVLDSNCEPWPILITPFAEYVSFSDPSFDNGIFCNPRNKHMVVYGKLLSRRFAKMFSARMVDPRRAASRT